MGPNEEESVRSSLIALMFIGAGVGSATAFCSQPSPPMFKPTPPRVPFCVDTFSNTHTCDTWEINSYNNDVETYNREVEDYIDNMQDYVDDAVAYAKCEISSL